MTSSQDSEFTLAERKQYQRQFILQDFGVTGQSALKKGRVLVIGAGGLGCPVLQYIAAAGVGTIGVIDGDVVDASNLHRQILFSYQDVGKSKADTAVEKLALLNPSITLRSYPFFLTEENALSLFAEYDVIVDGSDNFRTRYLVNDACVISKKVLVSAAIFQYEGQLSVFNYCGGPTYRCLFPEAPSGNAVPNCSEIGVLGVLPGVFGTLQANEVIKILTGVGEVLSGRFLTLNLRTMEQRLFKFPLNPKNLELREIKLIEQEECKIESEGIQIEDLLSYIQDPEYLIIDVRDDWELEFGQLENAQHIPLIEWLEQEKSQWQDEKRKLIFYCRTGLRSLQAVEYAKELGLNFSQNLEGGIVEWSSYDELGLEYY